MIRTLFWYVSGWVYLYVTFPILLTVMLLEKIGRLEKRDDLADKFTRSLARTLFYTTGSTIRITGQENVPVDKAVLFVSNHQGHMDSLIIHGFINRPKGFVSIVEVLKIPVIRSWMKYMKCVFLDRSDMRQSVKCLDKCVEILKQGHSMVIYPEGKLDEGGEVTEFKKGCLKLAIKAEVPILPITIKGSYKAMNKNASRINAATVECIISEPVHTAASGKTEKELIGMVRDVIVSKL